MYIQCTGTNEILSRSASPAFWSSWSTQLPGKINRAQHCIWIQNNDMFDPGLVCLSLLLRIEMGLLPMAAMRRLFCHKFGVSLYTLNIIKPEHLQQMLIYLNTKSQCNYPLNKRMITLKHVVWHKVYRGSPEKNHCEMLKIGFPVCGMRWKASTWACVIFN